MIEKIKNHPVGTLVWTLVIFIIVYMAVCTSNVYSKKLALDACIEHIKLDRKYDCTPLYKNAGLIE